MIDFRKRRLRPDPVDVWKQGAHGMNIAMVGRALDQPIAGAGDTESPAQRRERLKKRVQEVKARGTRGFLKVVAQEEGISVSRLKQILK